MLFTNVFVFGANAFPSHSAGTLFDRGGVPAEVMVNDIPAFSVQIDAVLSSRPPSFRRRQPIGYNGKR